ncbi:MAG: RNA polymerase II mediator complex subunit [Thelocarpon superellum]|nr:MAG: RNA polymerase II mediator complex subunit [Thelocarpon superellum]
MADRLTQLQDAFDQLATQFYASLRYISSHHLPAAPGASTSTSASNHAGGTTTTTASQGAETSPPPQQSQSHSSAPEVPRPDTPTTFRRRQHELARDLLLKEAQIEVLIAHLPGIERSEADQEARLKDLQAELKRAEEERTQAVRAREEVLDRLDAVVMAFRRV